MIAGKLPELWLASQQGARAGLDQGEGEETKAPSWAGLQVSLYIPVFLVNCLYAKGLKGLVGEEMVGASVEEEERPSSSMEGCGTHRHSHSW